MLQKRNTPVLRFRNLIFKDVLGVLEDWGFDHIKCFTFITQILEGHKISLCNDVILVDKGAKIDPIPNIFVGNYVFNNFMLLK